jgi:hypothetical protein|tara:strand:- start:7988 stop:8353 length:366 start_codon:yes stop_codon:yes gene_type:complete
MKQDGTPKRRSRPPLKHRIDKSEKIAIALSEQEDIETLIRDALSGMLTDITPRGSEGVPVKDNLDAMVVTCSEFMNNFIIMGYDLDGSPIQPLIHAKNQLEVDALGQYLQQYLHTIVSYMD